VNADTVAELARQCINLHRGLAAVFFVALLVDVAAEGSSQSKPIVSLAK